MNNLQVDHPPTVADPVDWDFFGAQIADAIENYREPTEEEIAALEILDAQIRWQKRHDERLVNCGAWSATFDIHSGRGKSYKFACQVYRECDTCLQARADLEQFHCRRTIHSKKIIAISMSKEEAKRFTRAHHKRHYTRYPQLDGTKLILTTLDRLPDGMAYEKINRKWVENSDWRSIVMQPPGSNRSGLLCLPTTNIKPKPFDIIATPLIVSNAPKMELLEIMADVVEETHLLDPKTSKEVVFCLQQRIDLTVRKLRERGYTTTRYYKKLKLEINSINWKVNDIGRFSCINR